MFIQFADTFVARKINRDWRKRNVLNHFTIISFFPPAHVSPRLSRNKRHNCRLKTEFPPLPPCKSFNQNTPCLKSPPPETDVQALILKSLKAIFYHFLKYRILSPKNNHIVPTCETLTHINALFTLFSLDKNCTA